MYSARVNRGQKGRPAVPAFAASMDAPTKPASTAAIDDAILLRMTERTFFWIAKLRHGLSGGGGDSRLIWRHLGWLQLKMEPL